MTLAEAQAYLDGLRFGKLYNPEDVLTNVPGYVGVVVLHSFPEHVVTVADKAAWFKMLVPNVKRGYKEEYKAIAAHYARLAKQSKAA